MLAQLTTVKARLGISEADVTQDALLTRAIEAVSARFDRECRRTLARTENFSQEFDAEDCEIIASCYPVERVAKFESKTSEAAGWTEIQPAPDYVVRRACVISLAAPPGGEQLDGLGPQFRVTYTGGYVLPGTTAEQSQNALPADLAQAAVEQVAYWYQNRDRLGVIREWPKGGIYEQFVDLDLLPAVRAVLEHYRRWG